MWILLLKFLLAHFLGDFVLQTKKMVENKSKPKYFLLHIFIHTTLLVLFLYFDKMWWPIAIVVLSHTLIDFLKIKLLNKIHGTWLFLIDQLLHLLVIVMVLVGFSTLSISLDFLKHPIFWLSLIAIVLVTKVAAVFIRILLSPYQHQKLLVESKVVTTDEKITFAAGKYIGILERLFILGFVIANYWEGVGFLLAAKSIFRFGDLNNAKERYLTEYVLIGTLLSFGWAIIIGLLFNYILKVVI